MKPTLRKAVPAPESSFVVGKDVGRKMKNCFNGEMISLRCLENL
jgi:hypothetical protein